MVAIGTLHYEVVEGWEQIPTGRTHLDVPGVGVDSRDRVFLFTRRQPGVMIYEADGTFVRSWGEALFKNCHGITIGPDDSVYLVDSAGHSVQKFTRDGKLLLTIGPAGVASDTGYDSKAPDHAARVASIKRGGGPYYLPTNLAVAPNGDLYVTDGYDNARVHQFTATGEYVRSWGEPGTGPGEFNLPHGIAVDAQGQVLVADRENERIQFFSPDGAYLTEWRDVQRPTQVRVGPDGLIYVSELWWRPGWHSFINGTLADERPGRVSVFAPDGTVMDRWGGREITAAG
ncbi:MAG TPA: 6-bladed beta-propeller, partial [Chloroflexota bacterium]|nr:6-bladed beta-propeller [Chloroflexota bacterium]